MEQTVESEIIAKQGTVFKASQFINASPHRVFETVIQLDEYPTWVPEHNPSGRKATPGPIGPGTEFELGIKGFGKVHQTLEEFEQDKRVFVVPHIRTLSGGHRFLLRPEGKGTRLDHELEMRPKGIFRLMMPLLRRNGIKTVKDTMVALQRHLEGS